MGGKICLVALFLFKVKSNDHVFGTQYICLSPSFFIFLECAYKIVGVCLFVLERSPSSEEGMGGVLFMRSQFPTPRAR